MPEIGLSFVRVLNIAIEIGRITGALAFKVPPPEYTFRGLEPLYASSIEHFEERSEKKYREITSPKTAEDGGDEDLLNQRFDDLEKLLKKRTRLINDLDTLLQRPQLHLRKHDDLSEPPELDRLFGPERYIERSYKGYGFSNDSIRQWLAAIPGPLGCHFETEESGHVNLTQIVKQVALAIIAGGSLLGPMILMTFYQGQHTRLIIVSVATVIFGVAFAIVSRSMENILAGTAAYAAVMVVYIGTASGSGGDS